MTEQPPPQGKKDKKKIPKLAQFPPMPPLKRSERGTVLFEITTEERDVGLALLMNVKPQIGLSDADARFYLTARSFVSKLSASLRQQPREPEKG